MHLIGTTKSSVLGESKTKNTRNGSDYQRNKNKFEGNESHRNKRAICKQTVTKINNPNIAKNDVTIIAEKNDVINRLAKLELQLNKVVYINKLKQ